MGRSQSGSGVVIDHLSQRLSQPNLSAGAGDDEFPSTAPDVGTTSRPGQSPAHDDIALCVVGTGTEDLGQARLLGVNLFGGDGSRKVALRVVVVSSQTHGR